MKKSKKLIAMLLTLLMLLSILPVAAFAETKEAFVSPVTGSVTPYSSVELMVGDTLAMKVYSSDPLASGTFSVVVTGDKDALEGCPDNVSKREDTLCNISAVKAGTVTITIGNAVLSVTVKSAEPAGDSVKYIDADGKEATATAVEVTKDDTAWSDWVYVTGEVTIENAVTLSDNVNLILADGASLEITKGISGSGKTLTVYAQSGGSGKLSVKGLDSDTQDGGVGITANLTVCGGIVDITGGTGGTNKMMSMGRAGGIGINGSVKVSGGEVEVKGGKPGSGNPGSASGAAGISANNMDSEVTVSGSATLTVSGGSGKTGSFGISINYSNVTLNGGVLNVTGGNSVGTNGGAGIYGGLTANAGSATIKGGNGGVDYTGGKAVTGTVTAEGLIVSKTEPDGATGGILTISSEPPHTHEVGTKHEAVAPTCTADGTIEWYSCKDTNCEAWLDAEGSELKSIVDPATGHTYGDPVAVWTGDICTATRTCSACEEGTENHSISETKQGTFVQDTAATCIEAAKGHYEVSFDDAQFGTAQTDANTVSNGNPIEHSYTGEYVQNEAHTQHAQLCVNGCGLPGEFTDCTGGEATCQAKAVCETCEHEYGELAGHSFTNYVYNNDASCTKAGTKTAKCDNCEATDTVDDLEHPQLEHSYTGEVVSNGNGTHSFLCENGCNEYGGTADCVDKDKDGLCDVCKANLDPLAQNRVDAIATLEGIVGDNTNEKVQSMLAGYVEQIENASSLYEINRIVSNATSALKQQIEIANEGSLISAIRSFVNAVDRNNQKTTNKVMGIIKPILGIFGIK